MRLVPGRRVRTVSTGSETGSVMPSIGGKRKPLSIAGRRIHTVSVPREGFVVAPSRRIDVGGFVARGILGGMREEDRERFVEHVARATECVRRALVNRPQSTDLELACALEAVVEVLRLLGGKPGLPSKADPPAAGLREGGAVAPDGTCLYATDLLRALAAAGMILEWKVVQEYGSSQASLSLRCLSCLRYGGFHGPECPKVKKS
jgi:hypothetical protein